MCKMMQITAIVMSSFFHNGSLILFLWPLQSFHIVVYLKFKQLQLVSAMHIAIMTFKNCMMSYMHNWSWRRRIFFSSVCVFP